MDVWYTQSVERHGQQMDVWYTQSVERHGQQMDVWYTVSAETWAADGCMVHTVQRHGQQMDVWYTHWRDMGSRWMYGTHSAETMEDVDN